MNILSINVADLCVILLGLVIAGYSVCPVGYSGTYELVGANHCVVNQDYDPS